MSETYDQNNIFAKILRGEIPCTPILDTEHALAFYDINPRRKVHILVTPKGAYINAHDFYDRATDAEIIAYHKAIATVIQQAGLDKTGYRLISNTAEHGGQEVPHLHTHILGGEEVGPLVG